jgi:hypothetical protein
LALRRGCVGAVERERARSNQNGGAHEERGRPCAPNHVPSTGLPRRRQARRFLPISRRCAR